MNLKKLNQRLSMDIEQALALNVEKCKTVDVLHSANETPARLTFSDVLVKHASRLAYTIRHEQTANTLLSMYTEGMLDNEPNFKRKIGTLLKQRKENDSDSVRVLLSKVARYDTINLGEIRPVGIDYVNPQARYKDTMRHRIDAFHQNFLVGHVGNDFSDIPDNLLFDRLSAPFMHEQLHDKSKSYSITLMEAVLLHCNVEFESELLSEAKSILA